MIFLDSVQSLKYRMKVEGSGHGNLVCLPPVFAEVEHHKMLTSHCVTLLVLWERSW